MFIRCIRQLHHQSHHINSKFSDSLNHYQILQLNKDASIQQIKSSFKRLSKIYHPDMNQNSIDSEIINSNYIKITTAYDILKNPIKRSNYDKTLPMTRISHSSTRHRTYTSGFNNSRKMKFNHHIHNSYNFQNPFDSSDVPHFDYDNHLRGNLWFERRMIQKRLNNHDDTIDLYNTKRYDSIQDEINDTMNLYRFHKNQSLQDDLSNNESNSKFVKTVVFLGVLAIGSILII